jgi:hypothetical protein
VEMIREGPEKGTKEGVGGLNRSQSKFLNRT